MNVLSLFDGISCGQLALRRAGVSYSKYFASEVDKHAIKVTQKNFPDTIQLGNVCDVVSSDLPKIDLLLGGSPCQGFSFAGKQLNFEDPKSKLFFEFVRLLKECEPQFFLLENVNMKKEYQNVISEHLGIQPIKINSSLVSAQNRVRLYWTNIPNVTQPADKGITLKDILHNCVVDENAKAKIRLRGHGWIPRKDYFTHKIQALVTSNSEYFICSTENMSQSHNNHKDFRAVPPERLSTDYSKPVFVGGILKYKSWGDGDPYKSGSYSQSERVYSVLGKSCTLSSQNGGSTGPGNCLVSDGTYYRKLSVVEAERLQTLPDNYTEGVSITQRFKSIGNCWTVDVVSHILGFLPSS